jgi:carbonic anhydrase
VKDTQCPAAVILGCFDSRVSAEIIFDAGIVDAWCVAGTTWLGNLTVLLARINTAKKGNDNGHDATLAQALSKGLNQNPLSQ